MTGLAELRASHMALAMRMLPDYVDRMGWDAARLGAHRSQALRDLLKVAVERSPWHRDRLAGVPLDAVRPDDLTVLPTMTKADVMGAFDSMVTDRRVTLRAAEAVLAEGTGGYLFDEYTVAATGGSTGARTVMLYDRVGLAGWWLSAVRSLVAWRETQEDLKDRQTVLAWVTASHPSHISALTARIFNAKEFRNVSLPVTLPMEAIVDGLNQAQPDAVVAYASACPPLVREVEAGRLRISPRRLMPCGEPLLPEIRTMLETTWPVPLDNRWGATECGAFTESCEHGFAHVLEDIMIIEPVDPDGRPVPPGSPSAKILLTNLVNHALPLIRYEITDEVATIPGPCPCGSSTMRVADVQGRFDDWFRYPTGDVHPHVFRSVLGRRPEIREYQVRQTPDGADVAMCCAGPFDPSTVAAELRRHLRASGLPEPSVSVTVVAALDRLPNTGKLRRFVPLSVTS